MTGVLRSALPSLVSMERAVEDSRHTLIVLTPAWVESQWTEFESLLAGTADPDELPA